MISSTANLSEQLQYDLLLWVVVVLATSLGALISWLLLTKATRTI